MSGKLGHPEGEVTLTRAAAKQGVIQMVSRFWTAAAVSPELKL
jgi:L-lactate dehydrogenase (cytochrome)